MGHPHGYRHSLRPGRLGLARRAAPLGLRVFLTALAIVDDPVAVTVIALFYTADISWTALAVGAAFLVALVGANIAGVGKPLDYGLLGVG